MLLIQQYLKNKIETLETLQERFGIYSKLNEDGSIVALDYDQIESSKHKEHRLVCECRGLKLYTKDWSICAKSFNRFFNLNENNDTEIFDWKTFSTLEKIDGSLFQISVKSDSLRNLSCDDDDFHCFTRFSFANHSISDLVKETWRELALSCLSDGQKSFMRMHPKYTYVFEFCSPYTQVVKFFPEPKMFMIGLFDNQTCEEVSINNEVYKQSKILFEWPVEYNFNSIDEIIAKLNQMFSEQSVDEGFVLKDKNGVRLKIKNKYYLCLHRLSNNNGVKNLKHLIPIVLSGETSEIEAYFPTLKFSLELIKTTVEQDLIDLKTIYSKVILQESQKDFALVLTKEFYTPFSGIFFQLRKEFGNSFTFAQVEEAFMKAEELVVKVYKSRGIIEDNEEN